MRNLNLGCGFDKKEGFLNVDNFEECKPDLLMDMENTPWPIDDNSFDYILIKHALEHVGADFLTFKKIMKEIYRVSSDQCHIEIRVPYYMHETWWSDPTHVRAFTPLTFLMMSKEQNDIWIRSKANYTMLAYIMDIDFQVESIQQIYDHKWATKLKNGEITRDQILDIATREWGVVQELGVILKSIKK